MESLAKLVWSAFRGARTASDPQAPQPAAATTRHAGGQLTNPETGGVGLLAAVTEPASSSYLRVANRMVVLKTAATTDLRSSSSSSSSSASRNDHGACSSTPQITARTFRENKSCRLCSYRLDGKTIYIYRSMEFCTRECRFSFFMQALYDKRHRERIGVPAGRRISEEVKAWLVSEEEERIFRHSFFR